MNLCIKVSSVSLCG